MPQPNPPAIQHSLGNGVSFLTKEQQSDGSFLSLSAAKATNFNRAVTFHSVFSTTLILQNLSWLRAGKKIAVPLKALKKTTAAFLLTQKTAHWSWNYWVRTAAEAKKMAYPDDLDDTFCALSGLFLTDETLITGEALASVTQVLAALEVKEGGPYRTWLVPADSAAVWTDVDLVVNANIAYFLGLQGITLPKLTKLFHQALDTNQLASPYYPATLPILYFLSRVIKSKRYKKILQNLILTEINSTQEPLYVALGMNALIQLGYPIKKMSEWVNTLLTTQAKNGSWPVATFYTGVNPAGKKRFYAGATALTTSYCLAAIARYQVALAAPAKITHLPTVALELEATVIKQINRRFSQLGSTLRPMAEAVFQKILHRDQDKQIVLLPYFFRQSLGEQGQKISDTLVTQLAVASVHGWIAYTLYDDVLDEEAELVTLPLANICLRELTQLFSYALPAETGFMPIFQQVMDQLEDINAWEVAHCRFKGDVKLTELTIPDYGDYAPLAQRSLGHALGSVALLLATGATAASTEVPHLLQFYHHFLIARQLNDDAHDWEKDLKAGQINSVGSLLLKQVKSAENKLSQSKISELIPELQKIFWYETIEIVCNEIEQQVALAKQALQKVSLITEPSLLIKLVEKQFQPVIKVRKERTQALQFIQAYQ